MEVKRFSIYYRLLNESISRGGLEVQSSKDDAIDGVPAAAGEINAREDVSNMKQIK